MSKKPKPTFYGPDGKPFDLAEWRRQQDIAKAKAAPIDKPWEYKPSLGESLLSYFSPSSPLSFMFTTSTRYAERPETANGLRERVEADLDALLPTDLDVAPAELPGADADPSSYADAYEAARRACRHDRVRSSMASSGEYQCMDCGRYISRGYDG